MRAVDITTVHMTEDGLQDLGERIRECKLLTQVVRTIACPYTLLADFWEERKWSKLPVRYILLVDQIQLDGSEISHIVFLIHSSSKHKQNPITTITTLVTTFHYSKDKTRMETELLSQS